MICFKYSSAFIINLPASVHEKFTIELQLCISAIGGWKRIYCTSMKRECLDNCDGLLHPIVTE